MLICQSKNLQPLNFWKSFGVFLGAIELNVAILTNNQRMLISGVRVLAKKLVKNSVISTAGSYKKIWKGFFTYEYKQTDERRGKFKQQLPSTWEKMYIVVVNRHTDGDIQ